MGCGTSTESGVHTENGSPQPSDYNIERASAVSRANIVVRVFVVAIFLLLLSYSLKLLNINIINSFDQ